MPNYEIFGMTYGSQDEYQYTSTPDEKTDFYRTHGMDILPQGYIKNLMLDEYLFGTQLIDEGSLRYNPTEKTLIYFNGTVLKNLCTEYELNNILLGRTPISSVRVATSTTTEVENISTSVVNKIIDGILLQLNDRLIVKDALESKYNGVYYVYSINPGDTVNVLRTNDASGENLRSGLCAFVREGTCAKKGFMLTGQDPIIENTSSISFTELVPYIEAPVDNDSLIENNGTVSIQLDDTSLTITSTGLKITAGVNRENIIELNDFPNNYDVSGKIFRVTSSETGVEYSDLINSFESLLDVDSFFSNSGKAVTVNNDSSGILYTDPSIDLMFEFNQTLNNIGNLDEINLNYSTSENILSAIIDLDTNINTVVNNINSLIYKYESTAPSNTHLVEHNLNTVLIDVDAYVYDGGLYKLDATNIQCIDENNVLITLSEEKNVKVLIQSS